MSLHRREGWQLYAPEFGRRESKVHSTEFSTNSLGPDTGYWKKMLIAYDGQFPIYCNTISKVIRDFSSWRIRHLGKKHHIGKSDGGTVPHPMAAREEAERNKRKGRVLILPLWYAQFLILLPELHLWTILHFTTAAHWGPTFSSRAFGRKLSKLQRTSARLFTMLAMRLFL